MSTNVSTSRRRQIVVGYLLAWTVVGLFLFSRDLVRRRYNGDPLPWTTLLAGWALGISIVAALGPAVLWLGRRFPIEPGVWGRRLALHGACSAVFATVTLGIEAAIDTYTGTAPATRTFGSRYFGLLVFGFHGDVVLYWLVVGVQSGIGYYQRYRRREADALRFELKASTLETELVRAQLGALKMQLQPHFLFNTLNAAMALVRQGDRLRAEETLALLSDLLRVNLAEAETQEVPLRRELDYLQLYLDLQKVRFQDRLQIEIDVAIDVWDAAVPHMGLQPIVENAIRHAVERRSDPGMIRLSAGRTGDRLVVRVSDDGPGFGPADSEKPGVGLANTRERLRQLYGDAGALETANARSGGAVVTMVLPYRALVDDGRRAPTFAAADAPHRTGR